MNELRQVGALAHVDASHRVDIGVGIHRGAQRVGIDSTKLVALLVYHPHILDGATVDLAARGIVDDAVVKNPLRRLQNLVLHARRHTANLLERGGDVFHRLHLACLILVEDGGKVGVDTILDARRAHRVILDGDVERRYQLGIVPRPSLAVDQSIARSATKE